MHEFQNQDSRQTLAQGLEEYVLGNPGLIHGRNMSPAAEHFFRCHDAVHVIFGCGTSLDDEAAVKIASIFGTTAGLSVLKGYRLHESLNIYKQLRVADVLLSIAHSVVIVARTITRCLAQRKRWPWSEYQPHLHVPLQEIREQFGIKVAHIHGMN
ncbi:hypothetical protein J7E62_07555 [Variovorax paradoxus]|nr:hypothetical protein [Variovorax paradoxus]